VAGDLLGERLGTRVERLRGDDLVDESRGVRLLGAEELGREEKRRDPRRPQEVDSPAYASADRQLPRVRAMGRRAGVGRGDRRVARAAMRRPAPTAKPWIAAMTGFQTSARRPMRRSPSRS
jgi:hypothetical protein